MKQKINEIKGDRAMDIVEYHLMMLPETRTLHKEKNGEFVLEVSKYRVFERIDVQTKKKYYVDYLRGTITKRRKRKFWFGFKEEEVFDRKASITGSSVNDMVKFLRNELKRLHGAN